MRLGHELRLKCLATGNPRPRIMWVTPTYEFVGGTLLVKNNVTKMDLGEYRCEARSSSGKDAKSLVITLDVDGGGGDADGTRNDEDVRQYLGAGGGGGGGGGGAGIPDINDFGLGSIFPTPDPRIPVVEGIKILGTPKVKMCARSGRVGRPRSVRYRFQMRPLISI